MPSGTYLCLNDADGDLYAAVSDMRACEALTPAFLVTALPALNGADAVVADANLPADTLTFLAQHCRPPLLCDPVSVKKAPRLREALPRLALLKPNRAEARALTGLSAETPEDARSAAQALLALGVERVLLSMGGLGAVYADRTQCGLQPCLTGEVASTNGCGDAFMAAAVLGLLHSGSVRTMARWGQAAAAICAQAPGAVNPAITLEAVRHLAETQAPPEG